VCDLKGPLTRWEGRETGTLHTAHCTGHFVLGWGRALERGRSAAQRWKERSTVDVDVVGRRLGGLWAVLVRTAIAGQERLGWVGNSGPHTADWDSDNPIRQGLAAHWCWQLEQLQAGGRATREQWALGCWSCARVCCRQMTRCLRGNAVPRNWLTADQLCTKSSGSRSQDPLLQPLPRFPVRRLLANVAI
jgi:hypothetical protein